MKIQLCIFLIFFFGLNYWLVATIRPQFKKQSIRVGGKLIRVEVADSPEELSFGLMYKKKLNEDEGMLFVFAEERPLSFWMKNTFLDLSICFFSKQKKLLECRDMLASKSEMQTDFKTYESAQPAQYALEMRLGWFFKNNIKVGDKLEFRSNK